MPDQNLYRGYGFGVSSILTLVLVVFFFSSLVSSVFVVTSNDSFDLRSLADLEQMRVDQGISPYGEDNEGNTRDTEQRDKDKEESDRYEKEEESSKETVSEETTRVVETTTSEIACEGTSSHDCFFTVNLETGEKTYYWNTFISFGYDDPDAGMWITRSISEDEIENWLKRNTKLVEQTNDINIGDILTFEENLDRQGDIDPKFDFEKLALNTVPFKERYQQEPPYPEAIESTGMTGQQYLELVIEKQQLQDQEPAHPETPMTYDEYQEVVKKLKKQKQEIIANELKSLNVPLIPTYSNYDPALSITPTVPVGSTTVKSCSLGDTKCLSIAASNQCQTAEECAEAQREFLKLMGGVATFSVAAPIAALIAPTVPVETAYSIGRFALMAPSVAYYGKKAVDIGSAHLNQTFSPGLYIPSQDIYIQTDQDNIYNAETGTFIGSTNEISNILFLNSHLVLSNDLQLATLSPATYRDPSYTALTQGVESIESANDIYKLTKQIHDTINYNQRVANSLYSMGDRGIDIDSLLFMLYPSNITALYLYELSPSNIEDKITQNSAICFDFAFAQQAALAEYNIQSKFISNKDISHAYLSIGDNIIVDPTWNWIGTLESHQQLLDYDIENTINRGSLFEPVTTYTDPKAVKDLQKLLINAEYKSCLQGGNTAGECSDVLDRLPP